MLLISEIYIHQVLKKNFLTAKKNSLNYIVGSFYLCFQLKKEMGSLSICIKNNIYIH